MRNYSIPSRLIAFGRLLRCSAYENHLDWKNQSTSFRRTKHLLFRKVQQAFETNPEEEEVAEATEDVVVQAAMAAAMAVVVVEDTRAGGVAAIEVPDRRAIRIDPRAIQETRSRSQDQCATGVRKRGTGRRTASDI
jgi:hypothetical protein